MHANVEINDHIAKQKAKTHMTWKQLLIVGLEATIKKMYGKLEKKNEKKNDAA